MILHTFFSRISRAMAGILALAMSLNGAEVVIESYGYLGAIYNQEFNGDKDSTIGLTARAGATFSFNNGLALGLGAAGAWAAYDRNGSLIGVNSGSTNAYISSQYPNTGDVSEAFVKYTSPRWELAIGRYVADFLEFDWLSGHTQGVGLRFNDLGVNDLDLWLTYFNSVLITGYQPNRIASELGTFYAYHPGGRNEFIGRNGGNVIAGGVNIHSGKFVLDPFVLLNTSLAGTNSPLFQVGVKLGFLTPLGAEWASNTLVRGMFQYAPQDIMKGKQNRIMLGSGGDDVGFFVWGDQEFTYEDWIKFGLGVYFVAGQGIWHINDNARFYGNWVNAYQLNYFCEDDFTGYGFGSFELVDRKLSLDALFAWGTYREISAVLKYKLWEQDSMNSVVGVGYVHNADDKSYKSGHLLVFTKLSY